VTVKKNSENWIGVIKITESEKKFNNRMFFVIQWAGFSILVGFLIRLFAWLADFDIEKYSLLSLFISLILGMIIFMVYRARFQR